MVLSIIAALSENRVIGRDGDLPWHLPDDMKRFRELTTGHTVIMGRRTFETLGGKPLSGRRNIVLTTHSGFTAEGFETASSLGEALEYCKPGSGEIFIIGGESVYSQALPLVDRLYLTLVHEHVEGDVFFPDFSREDFCEVRREIGQGSPPHTFIDYRRVSTTAV